METFSLHIHKLILIIIISIKEFIFCELANLRDLLRHLGIFYHFNFAI